MTGLPPTSPAAPGPASAGEALPVARGTAQVFAAEALLLPTGLLTAAYLTRALGPEGYGILTLAASLVAWVGWSLGSLFTRAAIALVSGARDWRPVGSLMLRLHLGLGAAAAALLWVASGPVASLLGQPEVAPYLRLFTAELFLFSVSQAYRQALVGTGRFGRRALGSLVRWPVRLVLIVALVELGLSITGAVLGSIAGVLVELLVYRGGIRIPLRAGPAPRERRGAYAPPLFAFALCVQLFGKVDLFALAALGGTARDAGVYGAAQNVAVVPGLFAASFAPVLLATLGRLGRDGGAAAADVLSRDAMRVVLAMLPFAGLAAGAADELVVFLFGAPFADAGPVLALLTFAAVAMVMVSVATVIMISHGRPGWTAAVGGGMLLVALPAHLVAVPRLGGVGAAAVTALVAAAGAVAAVAAVRGLAGVSPPAATLGRAAALCVGAWLAAALLATDGAGILLTLGLVGAAIPAGFLALGELPRAERRRLWSALARRPAPDAGGVA